MKPNMLAHQKNCQLWTLIQYDLSNTPRSRLELVAKCKRQAAEKVLQTREAVRMEHIPTLAKTVPNLIPTTLQILRILPGMLAILTNSVKAITDFF